MTACESISQLQNGVPEVRNLQSLDYAERYLEHRQGVFENSLNYLRDTEGGVAVISGPMHSSKSLIALALGECLTDDGKAVMYTKSEKDNRAPGVHSKNGDTYRGVTWMFEREDDDVLCEPDVLIIDEAQFIGVKEGQEYWRTKLIEVIQARREEGKTTIICLLDKDFKQDDWTISQLLVAEIAENGGQEFRCKSICMDCGEFADYTQRLVNRNDGQGMVPARRDDPVVMIGGVEAYEARCKDCHEVREAVGLEREV